MTSSACTIAASRSAMGPFDLDDHAAYRRWRDAKLRDIPGHAGDLVVEVRDPRSLRTAEHAAILRRCRSANAAIYASPVRDADREIPRLLGSQFGLTRLDTNWLAEDDGISSITVAGNGTRGEYIPYTERPIGWHTDGYYNPPARRVRAMLLHCVSSAARGGENALLDHDMAYIALRDADPAWIQALMAPDAMTIPARNDAQGVARPAETGPVFSVDGLSGDLHMRYTARTRSIEWKQDAATRAAVAALERVLEESPHVFRIRLEPGMGLICNNLLHDRAGFSDADPPRLLYRARYYERIAGTGLASLCSAAADGRA